MKIVMLTALAETLRRRRNMNQTISALSKLNDRDLKDIPIEVIGLEVGKKLAYVLSGGKTDLSKEISEDDFYNLELDAFMELIQTEKTQKRIKHTLKTGKPLVN